MINLHPNKYSREFQYNPFAVKLDRCVGSFYTLNHLSNKVCVRNKTGNFSVSVFIVITEINESESLTNQMLCKFKCIFNGRKCNLH